MPKESEPIQTYRLIMIRRELEAMSDWELERACAASLSFDLDRRIIADRILRNDMPKRSEGELLSGRLWPQRRRLALPQSHSLMVSADRLWSNRRCASERLKRQRSPCSAIGMGHRHRCYGRWYRPSQYRIRACGCERP